MVSLIEGYKAIIGKWEKENRAFHLMNLEDDKKPIIEYEELRAIDDLSAPHQIAREFFKVVINRQGIVIDRNNLYARLGISPQSKDIPALLEKLKENRIYYTGIFYEGWERWWSHRLTSKCNELCGTTIGNLDAAQRTKCLNAAFSLDLTPAVSRWTGKSDALFAFACVSCGQPTEMDYSVQAHDSVPYDFIEKKRICWKCIQKGEYKRIKGLKFHSGEKYIVDKIESGQIKWNNN